MSADLKVSIAMPVYNGGDYFELALQSALAQTYPNLEIVVVNDGSTDRGATEAIAKRYEGRITYVAQDNKGVAGALNTAIANMSGDIFTWLSHDDLFEPEKTATQVSYYSKMGRAEAILCSDWTFIDEQGKVMHDVTHDHARLVEAPMLAMLIPVINGCTLFIPRRILEEVGPFEEKYRFTQDYQLWNKILRRYDFFHIARKLVRYRIHPQQDSNKTGAAVEGDDLWIRIMDDRSEIERVQMFGSSKRFFERMGLYFQPSPYKRASEHALALSRTCVRDTLVSVILPLAQEDENARQTLMSVLCQTHSELEVLVVVPDDGAFAAAAQALRGLDTRVRLVKGSASAPLGLANQGLWAARGTYIAFAPAGSLMFPHRIESQLRAMQDSGKVVSISSCFEAPCPSGTAHVRHDIETGQPGAGRTHQIPSVSLMIHASLVSEGLEMTGIDRDGTATIVGLSARHAPLVLDQVLSIAAQSAGAPDLDTPDAGEARSV